MKEGYDLIWRQQVTPSNVKNNG